MYKTLKPLAFGAALAMSASAFAAGTASFSGWDTDNNNLLTKEEFQSGMRSKGLFNTWDTDKDGYLNRTEYDAVGWDDDYYGDWDSDNDDRLTEDETYVGTFSAYDEDENGHWDGDEWDDAGDEGWADI